MAERLSDLDHLDELSRMSRRMRALSLAVVGAAGDPTALSALDCVASEISMAMDACFAAFDAERQLRYADAGGAS